MHSLDFLYDLIGQYGLYAVFILVMLEGDITLLLAGVLAHSHFFGDRSFAWVLLWGTLGGCASDNVAYFAGRAQVWLSFNLFVEVYLRSALGLMCLLWGRAHALLTLSPGFYCQLLCLGLHIKRRRIFL